MGQDDDIEREERAIYLIAIVALAPVVIITLVERLSFDAGTTMCLAAVLLGVIGLAASLIRWLKRPRLPPARARRSSSRW